MKSESPNLLQTAKIISVFGHPFVLLSLTVLIVAIHDAPPLRALSIGVVTVLVTVFPLLFIIRRRVVSGKWSDHDVSDRAERRNFYPVVMTVVALSLIIFYLLDFPHSLLIGMSISLVLLLVAMFINRRTKISLHLIFAVYFAVSLMAVSYWIGTGFLVMAVAVGWSRVWLGRHTLAQVFSGAMLGAVAGVILLKVGGFF